MSSSLSEKGSRPGTSRLEEESLLSPVPPESSLSKGELEISVDAPESPPISNLLVVRPPALDFLVQTKSLSSCL
ncbi:uncharacterized protein MONOS_14 [Monocercomonoides exilis]|uniref:uncharacterized protein n=1 Tax=Monocercomonoides exilis TaxID=2049356 RepID=UPI00355AB99C|nr:hypothetical protein MONOS_14 [Monocercomonoides exilis]|eukprot:MONOS_14.1-p1 / transcript=MONOS_14.1 / gene=MONOS_14 / organism=Monocercomonoides_exilis_PA203 / gene_product=unspecified product / transcript_product=unspecified product / location=Mono_scaffold00001:30250-30471(-) / protein_length=74 / sequence_SO=supercontig / SO=protein_coding / is_pseudo=false